MANNPKKVKDPTEVALSAIQEALNISGDNTESSRASARSEDAPPPAPTYDEPTFDMRPSATERPMFEPIEEPRVSSRRPANDDRETIGQMLQAIQKGRPARSVYTLATLFGVVSEAYIAGRREFRRRLTLIGHLGVQLYAEKHVGHLHEE